MNKQVVFLAVAFLLMIENCVIAQKVRGFNIGLSLMAGNKDLNRKYYGQNTLPPGRVTDIKANSVIGGGLWGEQYISAHFSSIYEVGFTRIDVPTNTLCDCNYAGSVWLQDEKHAWVSALGGMRYYLNPKNKIVFFAEGSLKGDWFLNSSIKSDNKRSTKWSSFGYRRFAPSAVATIGAKWERISLSFGYDTNVARTFTRSAGEHDQIVYPFKTGFWFQGIFAKATLTVFKIR